MITASAWDYLSVMAFLSALAMGGAGLIVWGVWCAIRDRSK
jgi:hypothetical protein